MASLMLDALANERGVMSSEDVMRCLWAGIICLVFACVTPAPPTPQTPPDATPCGIIQSVDEARLIRLPDGGTFNEPCPADSGGLQ